MSVFRQIIFPSSPKLKIPDDDDVTEESVFYGRSGCSNELIWGIDYWFSHNDPVFTQVVVKCPICGKEYIYANLKASVDTNRLYEDIEANEKYFKKEWAEECPSKDLHAIIKDVLCLHSGK